MLRNQYARTMRESYLFARQAAAKRSGMHVLDCGSSSGHEFEQTFGGVRIEHRKLNYIGIEWNEKEVQAGILKGLDIRQSDLNRPLPVATASQDCVIAYSVLEHLLMPCAFLRECHRVIAPGGHLVVLTPNISTWFTALQIILGNMPSSGPHPDSNQLLDAYQPEKLSNIERDDVSADTPSHRHLIVFSRKVLLTYLKLCGFTIEAARGFGYYPLPVWLQPTLEKIDPWHCHQLVFVCRKPT